MVTGGQNVKMTVLSLFKNIMLVMSTIWGFQGRVKNIKNNKNCNFLYCLWQRDHIALNRWCEAFLELIETVKSILYAVFKETLGILDIFHSSRTKKTLQDM